MFLWCISSILLGGGALASPADDYLDALLQKPLEKEIRNLDLDPAPLPDFRIPFKFEYGLVPVTGNVDFHNGHFHGLSKVGRFNQCQGPTLNLKKIKFECVMKFFGFRVVYDGKAKIEPVPLPVPFQITAYMNETLVKSGISGVPAEMKGSLDLLEITKLGDVNVRPSNLGVFQYVYNAIEEKLRDKIREEAIRIITYQFPVPLKRAMETIRLPGWAK